MCVILIEGLDLAGKSTLLDNLRQHLPGPISSAQGNLCPSNPIAQLARSQQGIQVYERSCLRFASHLWDLRNFRNPAHVHVQDGCWLRWRAEDKQKGLDLPWHDTTLGSVPATAVILLTASVSMRHWRARKTRRSPELLSRPDQFLAVEHHLRAAVRETAPFLEIDTSKRSPQETLSTALAFLLPLLPASSQRQVAAV